MSAGKLHNRSSWWRRREKHRCYWSFKNIQECKDVLQIHGITHCSPLHWRYHLDH